MAESGYGAQLVNVTEDHNYVLDLQELDKLLLNDKIKDLPVVVVSVAGAYRGGKSFLLNFFQRYLKAPRTSQDNGSWLGEDSEPLTGFKWRSGSTRTTTGILMWSEPFFTNLPNGDQVAVLLMDTQGTFDSKSTVRDCSTIFGLSTLLSSVQVYNLSQNIKEDDLQNLQLFIEYGKLARDQGAKAFQVLEFLVRDWQFPEDYSYGAVGGDLFLQELLKVTPNLPKELQELRQYVRSSFEKVSCFLMPHPGFEVLRKDFSGNISDISIDFRTHLKDLTTSLFSPEKLMAKTINGQIIKAKELHNYFKTYMDLFNSGNIPNPTSIMQATVEAGLLSTLNDARELYEKGMNDDCGVEKMSVPVVDLYFLHTKHMGEACDFFTKKKKMGSKQEADTYLDNLKKELDQRKNQFVQSNLAKEQALITKGKEAYEGYIERTGKGQPLCVNPLELKNIHDLGVQNAIQTFDTERIRVTNKPDDARTQFIQSFEKKIDILRISNEEHNKNAVSTARMEYWLHMQSKTYLDPPLSVRKFRNEHEDAERMALEKFDSKRSRPSYFIDDTYRNDLKMKIATIFDQLQTINRHRIEQNEQAERDRIYEEERRREREILRRQQEIERIQRERRQREWEREMEERRRREEEKSRCSIL